VPNPSLPPPPSPTRMFLGSSSAAPLVGGQEERESDWETGGESVARQQLSGASVRELISFARYVTPSPSVDEFLTTVAATAATAVFMSRGHNRAATAGRRFKEIL